MKTYRSPDGEQRIWFEDDEIEQIMEDELRRAKLMPGIDDYGLFAFQWGEPATRRDRCTAGAALRSPHRGIRPGHGLAPPGGLGTADRACSAAEPRSPLSREEPDYVVDLEALIEVHLAATLDQFARLDHAVLGLTEFRPGEHPVVRINKDLTGSAMDSDWCPPGIQGRWRATLAHEAAHVVLHGMLFDVDLNQASLFGEQTQGDGAPNLLRCLKRDVAHLVRTANWREVQANRGMAALLMPKSVFGKAARTAGVGSTPAAINAATRTLAAQFGVSRQATTIRLRTLGFIREDEANSLFAAPD